MLLVAVLIGASVAGCAAPATTKIAPALNVAFQVVDENGAGIPYAQASILRGSVAVLRVSGDLQGRVAFVAPLGADAVRVGAHGFLARKVPLADVAPMVVLVKGAAAEVVEHLLGFLEPVDLKCPTDPFNTIRDQMSPVNCGRFGEPVLETTSDGKVWASATCCSRAPPIWLSRDEGKSFAHVGPEGTSWTREVGGVEGDLTVDAAGNVYYLDFDVVTSYDNAGRHRGTYRHLFSIDRPWIHGGARDTVYFLYNSGGTQFYKSTDAGLTWNRLAGKTFPCALGAFGQGPELDDLWVGAGCGTGRDNRPFRAWNNADPKIWFTKDGGDTWRGPESVPIPKPVENQQRNMFTYVNPVPDAAGNVYVVYTHTLNTAGEVGVLVSRRSAEGEWSGPFDVGVRGVNGLTWPVAGKAGELAIAFYHTDSVDPDNDTTAEWRVMAAVSVDANGPTPHFQVSIADPKPVRTGPMDRSLGDFLQTDLTKDGRLAIVYGSFQGTAVQNKFVASAAPIGG